MRDTIKITISTGSNDDVELEHNTHDDVDVTLNEVRTIIELIKREDNNMGDFAMEFNKQSSELVQDHSRHAGEAEFFASCGCRQCYRIVGEDEKTLTAFEILAVIRETVKLPAFVDQTGGGTATIYIGYKGPDGRYTLALGPGAFDWKTPDLSTFYAEDLSMGPDTEAQEVSDCVTINSLEDVRTGVKTLLLKMDERFKEVFT